LSGLDSEEEAYSPRWILLLLAGVSLVVLVGVAAALAVPLQPPLAQGPSCASGTACVSMPNGAAVLNFSPNSITVVMGVNNTVQWTNQDSVQHTVVVCPVGGGQLCAPSSSVAHSSILSHGDTFQVILNATGVYHFYCSIHPATMRGTIDVVGASNSSTTA